MSVSSGIGDRSVTYGKLTDEGIERLRSRIGQPVKRRTRPFCRHLTEDIVLNWARAIGDMNPLYSDPDYARESTHGGLLASPTVLYSTSNVVSGAVEGLPGVHAMYAGTEWNWLAPLRAGDMISSEAWLDDVIVKQTRFAGRALQEIYRVEFRRDDELVASARSWCFRTERDTARAKGSKYEETKERPQKVYTGAELEQIAAAYELERAEMRGPVPRYFDEVEVGDELPGIVRGPYTLTTAVGFMQAWGNYAMFSHGYAFDYYRRHPSLAILNEYGVPELPVRVHWDTAFAQAVGAPSAYDFGPERVSWLGSLVTNWAGDHGYMRSLSAQIRRHNCIGDTLWCSARVTDKRVDDGAAIVDLALVAKNQDGDLSVQGTASVELPLRTGGAA